ncbi:MAG: hypothetical protein R3E32_12590 [Chitinophagales bacterium]
MSKSLQINCIECNTAIHAEDINLDHYIAKCHNCHTVFDFKKQMDNAPKNRREVTMPDNVEMLRLQNELDITFDWWSNSKKPYFLIFFTLFWNSIVGIFVIVGLLTGQWVMLAAISIHLSIGVGLAYYLLCKYFNKTTFRVTRRYLTTEHRPFPVPFYGAKDVEVSEIDQLYCKEYVAATQNNVPVYAYAVYLITKDSQEVKVLKGLDTPQQALYIEQEVEKFLGLVDRKVSGELG